VSDRQLPRAACRWAKGQQRVMPPVWSTRKLERGLAPSTGDL
jgi:hypothetical protein